MAEDGLDQLANQIKKYLEFARRVMRRWWIIGIFTILGGGASVGLALTMTRYYQSRTLISWQEAVHHNTVLSVEEMRREENWLKTRLQETFSSHTLLMKIIKEMDLFPGMRDAVAPEVILEEFGDKLDFGIVGNDSFWISFEYKEPQKAQAVTKRLAQEFVNKNVHDKLGVAEATLTFMQREVKKTKEEMDKIESETAQFVSDHPEYQVDPATGMPRGVMPDPRRPVSVGSFLSVTNPELRRALARKGRLQAQLQLMNNPRGDPKLMQARQEVERARVRVAVLRRKYTDRHPDVQRAKRYYRQTQVQLNLVTDARRSNSGSVDRIRNEIAELDRKIARLSRKKSRRSSRSSTKPRKRALTGKAQLEMKWYQLTRDREVAKAKFDQLQERLMRAKVTATLERRQAENQFSVVDKANLPRKPSRPSRTKLALAGTALGGMLGAGLAVLLVLFDPRIYSEDDLKKACDLPLLAQIPKE